MAKKRILNVGKTCECNWGFFVLMVILFTLGLYCIIGGFSAQFQGGANYTTVLGWYFVGVLLFAFGKIAKWKSCESCNIHLK